jgi:ketosteroid isomerase-like protein
MSQQTAEPLGGVRIPLAPETRRHRTLDERIVVRFPALARWLAAAWARLPRDSRLRRAILVRRLRQGYAAASRRDFDFLLTSFDPGVEFRAVQTGPEGTTTFHGREGVLEATRLILEVFGDIRLDPEEVLDWGDRFLVTVKLSGHGEESGASIDQQLFSLCTLRHGLVVRQDEFLDRAEALEAARLTNH